MKKTLQQGLLAALIISITACGGGGGGGKKESSSTSSVTESSSSVSSSSSSVVQSSSSVSSSSVASSSSSSVGVVSTTYRVSINAPVINEVAQNSLSNFLVPHAMADGHELTNENFVIVIVNLAGEVTERIEVGPNDITYNDDGTYSINVPGNPRLDCLIVTSLDGPLVLPEVANINELTNFLFAPTTDENVDIDVGSTAGFLNFIEELGGTGTFADAGLNPTNTANIALVDSIINNVQEVINNQIVLGYDSIEEAIAAIQEAVIAIVEQEVLNVTNPASEEVTLASAITGGGIYWFEAYEEDYIEYGHITENEPESLYLFNGTSFELNQDENDDGDLRLVDGEWVQTADRIEVESLNDDGSINLRDSAAADDSYLVESTLKYSLSGRNIYDYLYATFDTRALAEYVSQSATFGEGATGFRLNITNVNGGYRLWFNGGDETGDCPWGSEKNANDFGGNCETLGYYYWHTDQGGNSYYDFDQASETLAGILSTDVAPATTGFKIVGVNWPGDNQSVNVQLINNEAKTARYYLMTWGNNGSQLSSLLAESTWSYISLPGDAGQAIRVDIPEAVKAYGDFDNDEDTYIFTVHNGFVRIANFEEAGTLVETGITVLDSNAGEDILGAVLTPLFANSICFDASSTTDNGGNSASEWTQANLHYWSPTPSDALTPVGTEWPGFAMAQKGSFYCYDFAENLTASAMPTELNVIFNNVGQSAAQTANLTFTAANGACYQNDAWTTLEACGFRTVADQSQDLPGTWMIGEDYLIFGENGSFSHIKAANDDVNCQVGLAHGTYQWDQLNGLLSVTLNTDTTAIALDDSCSIGGVSDIALEDGQLYIQSDGDEVWLDKVVATEDVPIAGAWALSDTDVFVFTANYNFAHGKVVNSDENCQVGVAAGGFNWHQQTSTLLSELSVDTTAPPEASSCSIPGEILAALNGDTLVFTIEEEEISLNRIGD